MRITRRIAATGIAAGILTALLAWAPAASATTAAQTGATAMACAPPASGQTMPTMPPWHSCGPHHLRGPQLETVFMAGMIAHHAAAVAIARLELARGTRPQLRTMARQIVASQTAQIGQMTGWLRAWYGLTPAQARARAPVALRTMMDRMAVGMRQMTARLAAVPAGPGFDRAFMEAMIPHHQMAVIASCAVSHRADHPQLRILPSQIITSQSAEIRLARPLRSMRQERCTGSAATPRPLRGTTGRPWNRPAPSPAPGTRPTPWPT
jgi:uncharacterized protein (DUF305 family)